MTRQFSQYNIEISSSQGVSIDVDCPVAISAYKLQLLYLKTFPETFFIKMTPENQEKEWHILKSFIAFFDDSNEVFFNCHSALPKLCYRSFNLVSDDQKTVYLFVSKNAILPILVKGIANKIAKVSLLNGADLPFKQSNRLHNSAGVLWINTAKAPLKDNLNIIEIKLGSKLNVYLGSGAPITQN